MIPDAARLERWIRANLPGFESASVRDIAPVEGGASNVTCHVDLDGPTPAVALRLQRDRGIFEPYDVLREGEVLRCLAASTVPVPAVLGEERTREPLGAPFLVLEWVDAPHMGNAPDADFGAFTAMVARIHGLDWKALGLGLLGVPAGPKQALLGELAVIAARMPAFGCDTDPLLVRALGGLRASVPGDGRLALCQGDINVFNYLFRGGKVAAVVDWEQARISDPRSDVGHLLALSHLKGTPWMPADAMPFAQAYGAVSGGAVHGMGWFRARWLFELGVIWHGWVSFNGSSPWYARADVEALLGQALAEIEA